MVTNGMINFEAHSSPQLGDIAAGHGTLLQRGWFSDTYRQGHAAIVFYGEVVVSANETYGVRVGRFSPTSVPSSGFTYLRYKP